MKKKYIDLLKDLGLQESESKVYFAALKLGPSPVQVIAREAGISRTAAYTAIELLVDRKIFTSSKRGLKQVYIAESPERLLSHLKSEMRKMQEKVEVMEQSIDDIKYQAGGDKPVVRFYEGKDIFRALAQDVSKKQPARWHEIANLDDVNAMKGDTEYEAMQKLLGKALGSKKRDYKILHLGEPYRKAPGREYKPIRGRSFHGSVFIYGNTVGLLTVKNKMVMALIENPDIAQTMRVLFEEAFNNEK
ncbi:MAG TPA: helix-turn-helix domain-containing protein [Patescibacteria group bacterium]|nr:helix-turn-helix domain-containing protein [Patescibacteria group bacterium]